MSVRSRVLQVTCYWTVTSSVYRPTPAGTIYREEIEPRGLLDRLRFVLRVKHYAPIGPRRRMF